MWQDEVEALRAEAERGSGEAATRLAAIAALGVGRAPNYDEALNELLRAAQFGYEPARQQLRFLTRRTAAPDGATAHAGIDLRSWTRSPDVRVIVQKPRIGVVDAFATPEECEWLVALARERLSPAAEGTGGAFTGSEAIYDLDCADVVLALMRERIAAAVGVGVQFLEPARLVHYYPGEQFAEHFAFIEPGAPGADLEISRRGQRVAAFFLYLNDDYSGGETVLPHADIRHHGQGGSGLVFTTVDLEARPGPAPVVAELPPSSGEKWMLIQGVRNRPQ
jgi:prolyl 4-hydroxylase